jgi:hypothetical protein
MSVPFKGLIAGAAGAIVLTALHEVARRSVPNAPRLDVLGMRGMETSLRATGQNVPNNLHKAALGADLAANTIYYSLVGTFGAGGALAAGMFLGAAAGLGSVMLPRPLGLGGDATNRSRATEAMSIGMYEAGGLIAGSVYRALSD